jgi:pterin-4a-carbinolamine dehydratase
MPDDNNPIPNWHRQDLPPMLSRRFEFETYPETRRFLDGIAKLAEAAQHYPNLSFGKTYVSVTLDADGKKIGPDLVALAQQIDTLVARAA